MKITNDPWLKAETTYETFDEKHKLTRQQYKKILDIFGILVFKAMTERKEVIKLPYGLGNLFLRRCNLKSNARQVDYNHYTTTGELKLTRRNTLNLDGYLKTTWDKRKEVAYTLNNTASYVQFKPNRVSKRSIMQYIKGLSSLVGYHK